jgi:hypothetical protein
MKPTRQLFCILLLLLFATQGIFAQEEGFESPEGFKWNQSKVDVKKIKVDDPLSITEDQIIYSNGVFGGHSIFMFKDDKLISFHDVRQVLDKKKVKDSYEKTRKMLVETYGEPKETFPSNNKKSQPTYVWYVKGTEIRLTNFIEDEVRIEYKKL